MGHVILLTALVVGWADSTVVIVSDELGKAYDEVAITLVSEVAKDPTVAIRSTSSTGPGRYPVYFIPQGMDQYFIRMEHGDPKRRVHSDPFLKADTVGVWPPLETPVSLMRGKLTRLRQPLAPAGTQLQYAGVSSTYGTDGLANSRHALWTVLGRPSVAALYVPHATTDCYEVREVIVAPTACCYSP